MAGKPRKLETGRLAYFCDSCGSVVVGDGGYLTVVNRSNGKRWAVFHDSCQNGHGTHLAGQGRITVRLSRVADYPLLLTTMASLAADVIGFETTNWWTFLLRVVHDTEWQRAEGNTKIKQLHGENYAAYVQAGFTKRKGIEGIR